MDPTALVIALGTGRSDARHGRCDGRDCCAAAPAGQSLIGNIAPDGSASFFDVVMRLADKVRAPHYPMPVPVISPTAGRERGLPCPAAGAERVVELAETADVIFVGVGQMSDDAPLLKDGFVSRVRTG